MPQVLPADANILTGGGQNPLDTVSKYVGIQNLLTENAQRQLQLRAQQGLQAITQQATGPDGQLDTDKFTTLVASHPEVAPIAQDILTSLAQRRLIDAHTTQTNLIAAKDRMDLLGPLAATYSRTYTGQAGNDMTSFLSDAFSIGAVQPGKEREQIPFAAQMNGLPPDQVRQRMARLAMMSNTGSQTLGNFIGTFKENLYQDNAGNKYPGWVRPMDQSIGGGMGIVPASGGGGFGALPPSQGFPGAPAAAGNAPASGTPAPNQPQAPQQPQLTLAQPGPRREEALKEQGTLDNSAAYATTFINNLDEGKHMLNDAMTGRAIPTRLDIGRWAKAFGVSQAKVDALVGGSVNTTQALGKLMLFLGTQGMRQANEGNAAVRSVQEWQRFIEASPNLATDPGAIRQMWSWMKFQNISTVAEQKALSNWKGSPADFRVAWNQEMLRRGAQYQKDIAGRDWDKDSED